MDVTPWEVKKDINYQKLIDEFGLNPMPKLSKKFNDDILFRRKTIFAQRNFKSILDALSNKKRFVMMTGLMPTGKFHIGHLLVAKQILFYQSLGANIYLSVADIESYHARNQTIKESRKNAIEEYIINYIALGLKPKRCEIYFQSDRSNDSKRSNAYYLLQNLLAKHTTFNEFKAVYGDITPGKMVSALLQGSDMLHPQLPEFEGPIPTIIPVGVDQDPHIRLARDMSKRIKEKKFIQISSTYHRFIPGLSGGKMSSSEPNSFIALTDSPKEAEKKIKRYAFSGGGATIEEHREKGGNPDIDISFQYLNILFEEDDAKLKDIYDRYRSGELLTGELKQILIDKVSSFLETHQKNREKAYSILDKFI